MSALADLKLCADAVAPWEGLVPLPFAVEALRNISADLFALELAMYPEDGGGITDDLAHRVLAGIQNRAEAAATLAGRLQDEEVKERAERDLDVLKGAAAQRGAS